jgi:hypothetical protein
MNDRVNKNSSPMQPLVQGAMEGNRSDETSVQGSRQMRNKKPHTS